VEGCEFVDNSAYFSGGALRGWLAANPSITKCSFVNNGSRDGGAIAWTNYCYSSVEDCTFHANEGVNGSSLYCASSPTAFRRSIVSFGLDGEAVSVSGTTPPSFECCDIYANAGGDWTGEIANQHGVNGNFSEDPLFCAAEGDAGPMLSSATSPYSLHLDSPCLPGNHPSGYDCGLIGAHGLGCGASRSEIAGQPKPPIDMPQVEKSTWGRIKVAYR
jgi:hypothetical protein